MLKGAAIPLLIKNNNSEARKNMIVIIYEKKIKVVTCSWSWNFEEFSIRYIGITGHCQTERVRVSSCDGDFTFPVMGTCNLSIGLIRYSMKCNDDEISLLLFAIDICIITELSKNEVYLKCCS